MVDKKKEWRVGKRAEPYICAGCSSPVSIHSTRRIGKGFGGYGGELYCAKCKAYQKKR